jgi:hypothetical protein
MRRALTLAALTALAVAVPALAGAVERVSVKPRAGDVNTRFVYRGSDWKPNSRIVFTHGALCGTGPCILPLYFRFFESNAEGRFKQSERPTTFVQDDWAGYTVCFGYQQEGDAPDPEGCVAIADVTLAPPSASATPALARRNDNEPIRVTVTAAHFKARSRLKIHIRKPGGAERVLDARARRHGGHVGPANAYAPRGGFVRLVGIRVEDPDGTYRVRVVDRNGHRALTSFVVKHWS